MIDNPDDPSFVELIEKLEGLDDDLFVVVLEKVFQKKIPFPLEMDYSECHFFLGIADRKDEHDMPGPNINDLAANPVWSFKAVGYPDCGYYAPDCRMGGECCQGGYCENCKLPIRSVWKNAICPLCGKEVYCT